MYGDSFKVLIVDLTRKTSTVEHFGSKKELLGGSGLGAGLYHAYGLPHESADHPDQPLIFAIGSLTGFFPLMSKTVAAFKSPYNQQYAESHAGGRSALALRFSGYDALVIRGKAPTPSCLIVGSRTVEIRDVHYLWGQDVVTTGKMLRKIPNTQSGNRSILRIGPAGENGVAYACINADTFRHFGRLGSGAVMGMKKLKGIIVNGDGSLDLPKKKEYAKLYKEVYKGITEPSVMRKYHNLGTAENLAVLNELKALPWNNLQATCSDTIDQVSGERFAQDLLLRNTACAGCPVGCIHVGLLREKFGDGHDFLYRQVSYDYEPIFAVGTMLGMEQASHVMTLLEDVERMGLDVISAGVALAWATEALEKGIITQEQTLTDLRFGYLEGYRQGLLNLSRRSNEFYHTLGQGAGAAAARFGGEEFACVLGQEMAGYATGEAYYVSQAYGLRHSHLDSGGYSFDQAAETMPVDRMVDALVEEERKRVQLTCMVACLFSRKTYSEEVLMNCLGSIGLDQVAESLPEQSAAMQRLRWGLKFETGFDPDGVNIPKRYQEVVTWKGSLDPDLLQNLAGAYSGAIRSMADQGRTMMRQGLAQPDATESRGKEDHSNGQA
ncbi:MAG: aldehyde ferredoxin oxidoreductase N-terminal domain-containing protein [Desulfovibrionales bacterium]